MDQGRESGSVYCSVHELSPPPSAGIADEKEQRRHFLRLWTLKEAYVKALGRGVLARPGLQVLHQNTTCGSDQGLSLSRRDGPCDRSCARAPASQPLMTVFAALRSHSQ